MAPPIAAQHCLWYMRSSQSEWCCFPFLRARPIACKGLPQRAHGGRFGLASPLPLGISLFSQNTHARLSQTDYECVRVPEAVYLARRG